MQQLPLRLLPAASKKPLQLYRAGQLWVNDGEWAGEGQLVPRDYSLEQRSWVYPGVEPPYGYLTYVRESDPVDPGGKTMRPDLFGCHLVTTCHQCQSRNFSAGAARVSSSRTCTRL